MKLMISKRIAVMALGVAVALTGFAGNADAQKKKPKGNWIKLCEENVPISKDKKAQICQVMQEQIDPLSGLPLAAVAVRRVAKNPKMRRILVTVPLNMILRQGVRLNIDKEKKPVELIYTLCGVQGCVAEAVADDALIKKLKKGGEVYISSISVVGRLYRQKMSLVGFGKAFDGKPFDKQKYLASRKKLAKIVQQNRKEFRKRQIAARKKAQDDAKKKKAKQ